jgi:hypothetical protein
LWKAHIDDSWYYQGIVGFTFSQGYSSMKKIGFNEKTILSLLEELCQSLGIQVRYEPIKKEGSFYPGGLCRVKGEQLIILNSGATNDDKIQALAKAVTSFDLDQVYLKPALREFLFQEKKTHPSETR